jgi:hypothetical protein
VKTLNETLQEVMKHAISGSCRPEPAFGWHCSDSTHATEILGTNGYTVITTNITVPFGTQPEERSTEFDHDGIYSDRPSYTSYSARSSNRFDPPPEYGSHIQGKIKERKEKEQRDKNLTS